MNRPAIGATIRYADGKDYVVVRYPIANLDVLDGMFFGRRADQKRAVRLKLSAIIPAR
jgi:hypothetical protein